MKLDKVSRWLNNVWSVKKAYLLYIKRLSGDVEKISVVKAFETR